MVIYVPKMLSALPLLVMKA